MVLNTSDSTSTLVSLEPTTSKPEEGVDHVVQSSGSQSYWDWPSSSEETTSDSSYVRTALFHPSDDGEYDRRSLLPVYLPSSTTSSSSSRVDECLKHVPQVVENCDELLANPPRYFDKSSDESFLYVAQGEVAHAVPTQGSDILVSDKATTCHILALRSRSNSASSLPPLTSLTHLDGTSYEDCIRGMFQEHCDHHVSKFDMDLYVLGGFDDVDSTSIGFSNWLLHTLAKIAEENTSRMNCTLRLCCVSSLNDNGYSCPIGRGLGINLKTGDAFLAKVDTTSDDCAPAMKLRSARPFATSSDRRLSIIHSSRSNNGQICIEGFHYEKFAEIDQLLQLPDEIMLQYMSTSPTVEEACFCDSLRATLRYIRNVDCFTTFGKSLDQPLIYKRTTRSSNSNTWERRC